MCLRYKFDDERVTKEDMKKALDELYGGEEEVGFCNITSYVILPPSQKIMHKFLFLDVPKEYALHIFEHYIPHHKSIYLYSMFQLI